MRRSRASLTRDSRSGPRRDDIGRGWVMAEDLLVEPFGPSSRCRSYAIDRFPFRVTSVTGIFRDFCDFRDFPDLGCDSANVNGVIRGGMPRRIYPELPLAELRDDSASRFGRERSDQSGLFPARSQAVRKTSATSLALWVATSVRYRSVSGPPSLFRQSSVRWAARKPSRFV